MATIKNIDKKTYNKIQNLVFELEEYGATELEEEEDDAEYLSYHLIMDEDLSNLVVMSCYGGFSDEDRTFYKFENNSLIEATELEDDLLRKMDDEINFLNQVGTYFIAQKLGKDETIGDYDRI